MKTIEEFIDLLVLEKGFDTKDQAILDQIKSDLTSRFEDRINAMIITNLSEDLLPEFEKLLDSNNQEEINTFLKKHIPGIEEKLASEMLQFKNMYLS